MSDKEAKLQSEIKKWLQSQGFWVDIKTQTIFEQAGVPDLIAVRDGKVIFFEVKATKQSNVRPVQEVQIERIRKTGTPAYVVWSLKQVEEYIKEHF